MVQTGKGFVVFDDTVADKDFSHKVELVRLMDSWYATQEIMLTLEKYEKSYFGLDRSRETARQNHHEQRLSTQRVDNVVTNDMVQDNTQVVQEVCGLRWKVGQFHRETKQLTGLDGCQCRKARIVRNHRANAILVWVNLFSGLLA